MVVATIGDDVSLMTDGDIIVEKEGIKSDSMSKGELKGRSMSSTELVESAVKLNISDIYRLILAHKHNILDYKIRVQASSVYQIIQSPVEQLSPE